MPPDRSLAGKVPHRTVAGPSARPIARPVARRIAGPCAVSQAIAGNRPVTRTAHLPVFRDFSGQLYNLAVSVRSDNLSGQKDDPA